MYLVLLLIRFCSMAHSALGITRLLYVPYAAILAAHLAIVHDSYVPQLVVPYKTCLPSAWSQRKMMSQVSPPVSGEHTELWAQNTLAVHGWHAGSVQRTVAVRAPGSPQMCAFCLDQWLPPRLNQGS